MNYIPQLPILASMDGRVSHPDLFLVTSCNKINSNIPIINITTNVLILLRINALYSWSRKGDFTKMTRRRRLIRSPVVVLVLTASLLVGKFLYLDLTQHYI